MSVSAGRARAPANSAALRFLYAVVLGRPEVVCTITKARAVPVQPVVAERRGSRATDRGAREHALDRPDPLGRGRSAQRPAHSAHLLLWLQVDCDPER